MPLARNHHFLPQGYLGHFTDTGTRDGRLHVFDLPTRKFFRTRPRNVAAQKDFNRIEVDGKSPDFLETELGKLEDKAVSVIREMSQTKQLAKNEDLVYVINLIALLVVRNPRARQSLVRAKQQTAKVIGHMLVSNKAVYKNQMRHARAAGHVGNADVSYERMKAFMDGGKYTIEVARHGLIRTELSVFDSVLKTVGSRHWSLLNVANGGPDFITCDHPVTNVFKDSARGGPIGVGLPQTEIMFPVGPRQALRGVFEDPFGPGVTIKPLGVAAMNTRVLRHADRQLFSREPEFCVMRNGEMVSLSSKR